MNNKTILLAGLASVLCPIGASAQQTADALVDQADPAKTIEASSNPKLGELFPLSETLFVDFANNRVGINTTEPQTRLHVKGRARVWSNSLLTENLAQGAIQVMDLGFTRGWSADPTGFQSYGGPLRLNPFGLHDVRLTDTLVVKPNGIVGLGREPEVAFDMIGVFRTNDTIISEKATGAPFEIASTFLNTNLNADLLDGFHASEFSRFGDLVDSAEIAPGAIQAIHLDPSLGGLGGSFNGPFSDPVTFEQGIQVSGAMSFGQGAKVLSIEDGFRFRPGATGRTFEVRSDGVEIRGTTPNRADLTLRGEEEGSTTKISFTDTSSSQFDFHEWFMEANSGQRTRDTFTIGRNRKRGTVSDPERVLTIRGWPKMKKNVTHSLQDWADRPMVGINFENPSYTLDVFGPARATQWLTYSDERLKKDIRSLESSRELIGGLRGVSYQDQAEGNQPGVPTRRLGFIAQEVREVLPYAVEEDDEGILSVDYDAFLPLLVETLKAQDAIIEELNARIAALEEGR